MLRISCQRAKTDVDEFDGVRTVNKPKDLFQKVDLLSAGVHGRLVFGGSIRPQLVRPAAATNRHQQ